MIGWSLTFLPSLEGFTLKYFAVSFLSSDKCHGILGRLLATILSETEGTSEGMIFLTSNKQY